MGKDDATRSDYGLDLTSDISYGIKPVAGHDGGTVGGGIYHDSTGWGVYPSTEVDSPSYSLGAKAILGIQVGVSQSSCSCP